MNTSDGYFDIMNIPSGSRHILIEELAASKNYISLRNAASNESYLNANRLILMPGEFAVGKSMGLYERDDEQEKIKIPGPIQHEMTLSVSAPIRASCHNCLIDCQPCLIFRFSCGAKVRAQASNTNTRCQ